MSTASGRDRRRGLQDELWPMLGSDKTALARVRGAERRLCALARAGGEGRLGTGQKNTAPSLRRIAG